MNLVVFGASGPTGSLVVKRALELGHNVTAIVRNPENFSLSSPNLKVVKGDATVQSSFEDAIAGKDAVLSALGAKTLGVSTIYSDSGKAITAAMRKHNVKRFIFITSAGLEDKDPSFPFTYRYFVKPMLLRNVYADAALLEKHTDAITDIDWTVVRPTYLKDTPFTGVYRVSGHLCPKGGSKIARADVAHFMVKELDERKWVRKKATLAY